MRKLFPGLLGGAVLAVLLTGASPTRGDGVVQTTVPHCSNAYAILGWSEAPDDKVWDKIGWAMYTHPYLEITGDVERGVAQKASFEQYGVRGHDSAVAYVMRCGHGGTCNDIAVRYFRWYKRHGIPAVFCGPLPAILENPTKPSIPKPDLTDYYKPETLYYDDYDEDIGVDDFFDDDDVVE